MPFEAAAHERPCLFASHTALAETLPGRARDARAVGPGGQRRPVPTGC